MPQKAFNHHLFGFHTLQLGDDDVHFSTRLFNVTPRSSDRGSRLYRT